MFLFFVLMIIHFDVTASFLLAPLKLQPLQDWPGIGLDCGQLVTLDMSMIAHHASLTACCLSYLYRTQIQKCGAHRQMMMRGKRLTRTSSLTKKSVRKWKSKLHKPNKCTGTSESVVWLKIWRCVWYMCMWSGRLVVSYINIVIPHTLPSNSF